MRKTNVYLIIALALALVASLTLNQFTVASAQTNEPVGVVVEYVPGQSITIVDQQGNQSVYSLSPSLKILPPGRASSLAVGSFVTVIAPASLSAGKQMAVGLVVHPQVPNGWNVPTTASATPLVTGTSSGTETATPTGTLATETATPFFTETPTVVGTLTLTETATPTPVGALTDTPTPTATPMGGAAVTNTSFFDWLRSLFQQALGNR